MLRVIFSEISLSSGLFGVVHGISSYKWENPRCFEKPVL